MEKPELHVVSFSGGKDSTAMLLRMLEECMKVDIILFCDTGLEFPQLYEHIKRIEDNIHRKVMVVKADHDFEYLFASIPVTRKRDSTMTRKYGFQHTGYGWAGPKMRWCTELLKSQPRRKFLNNLKEQYNIIEYVGIAADETYRMTRKCNQRPGVRLPLVEWGMSEADCLAFCKERGYDWGGLYDKVDRVSCWCCPLQSLKELRVLYHDFPHLWNQLKRWDSMTWRNFRADYSVKQLEKRFDFENEWRAEGKPLGTKAFYSSLRQRLEATDE